MADATLNSSATLVAGTFYLFSAPVGTTLPTDIPLSGDPGDGLDSAFLCLGHTDNAGSKFKVDTQSKDLFSHQEYDPLRNIITSRKATIESSLLQWDSTTIVLAFGGGAVTSTPNGGGLYKPPGPGEITETSMVADIIDGDNFTRIVAERGIVAGSVEGTLQKDDWAKLPIVYTALAPVTQDRAWVIVGPTLAVGS